MKQIIIPFFIIMMISIFISCESSTESSLDDKMLLHLYASADSTIDSLYLSRYGKIEESITQKNLGISNAEVILIEYNKTVADTFGLLTEYPNRKGVYFLPDSLNFTGFKTGLKYRIAVKHTDYLPIYAETTCPEALNITAVYNSQTGKEMNVEVIDTLYYERGKSPLDFQFIECQYLEMKDQLASFRLIPEERDENFWLEDTTSSVWDEYPESILFFKDKKKYGEDQIRYFSQNIKMYWVNVYSRGYHNIVFSATDEVYKSYREGVMSDDPADESYTNIIGGDGIFTINNSTNPNSRYRVYIKSLEER